MSESDQQRQFDKQLREQCKMLGEGFARTVECGASCYEQEIYDCIKHVFVNACEAAYKRGLDDGHKIGVRESANRLLAQG